MIAAATASAAILTLGLAVPADAVTGMRTPSPSPASTVTTVSAPLQIDCSTVTAAGRKYAVEHNVNFCGILGPSMANPSAHAENIGVTPDTSATSNCGTATISMWSLGGGRAYFNWHLYSSSGLIIYYSVGVVYHGTTHAGTLPFSGAFPGIEVAGGGPTTTGSGFADAYLGGSVSTLLYDCTVLNPSTHAYV